MENASANQPIRMNPLPPAFRPVERVLFSKLCEELTRSLLVTEERNRERIHVLRDRITADER